MTAVISTDTLEFAAPTGFEWSDVITGGTSGARATTSSSGMAVMSATPMVGFLQATGSYSGSNAGTEPFIKGVSTQALQGRTRSVRFRPIDSQVEFAPDMIGAETLGVGHIEYLDTPTFATSGGTPAGTVAAPALTMNPYTPAGTVAAPAFTGTLMAPHTHIFTGAGGSIIVINVGGITPGTSGFNIGTDVDINVLGANLFWLAGR